MSNYDGDAEVLDAFDTFASPFPRADPFGSAQEDLIPPTLPLSNLFAYESQVADPDATPMAVVDVVARPHLRRRLLYKQAAPQFHEAVLAPTPSAAPVQDEIDAEDSASDVKHHRKMFERFYNNFRRWGQLRMEADQWEWANVKPTLA